MPKEQANNYFARISSIYMYTLLQIPQFHDGYHKGLSKWPVNQTQKRILKEQHFIMDQYEQMSHLP